MTMSVDGLVSGMDTTSIITQLLQAEANPQVLLKQKLSTVQTQASAYRTVNTTVAAVRAAAEALSSSSLSAARKASSSSPSVAANAGAGSVGGSTLTFTVTGLARTQTDMSRGEWTSLGADARTTAAGDPAEPAWPLEIRNADGSARGSVDLPPGATLAQAVHAINGAGLGVQATAVKVADGSYRLQIGATASGTASAFQLRSATESDTTAGSAFLRTSSAQDATIALGGGVVATSPTNSFADLLAGVSVTVSAVTTDPVTVSVAQDTDGIAARMQTLVDAVNAALSTIRTYTNNDKGSTAALKGDTRVTALSGQLLQAVSAAVGGDGSPARIGIQLSRDGKVSFDKAAFTAALQRTPELAQRMVAGRVASDGRDGVAATADDVPAVTGIAGRLLAVATSASDSTTGSIVALAKGKDSIADDLKGRIEAWDLRLAKRKESLTRQFTAMETALSSLRNQSTWLAGQINGLPSSS